MNPNSVPVTPKGYTLQVIDAAVKSFTYGPNAKLAGQEGNVVKLGFAIVGDEEFSGRKIYNTTKPLFIPGNASEKMLRRLMDATGYEQVEGQEFGDWVTGLKGARFDAPVEFIDEIDKRTNPPTTVQKSAVNLWDCSPASN